MVIVLLESIMNHSEIGINDYCYNDTPKDANSIISTSLESFGKQKDRNRINFLKIWGSEKST